MSQSTKEELYERATELDVQGRGSMSKAELERAIAKAELMAPEDDEPEGETGTEVAAENQAALEQSSDEVAAETGVADQGEVATPVKATGRGVGFRR